ncbi:beta-galactosidase [Streptosporangium sp. NPDC023963]|uniref:beta-galactosidase n=1 Tax=Streptosporangium sp. NPDC023963 TaxID=3155608 RepID=UPI0034389436
MIVYGDARNPERWPERAWITPVVLKTVKLTLRRHREMDRFGFGAEVDVVAACGIAFFQWRTSRTGAEKRHPGTVPHAGVGTKIWREVATAPPEGAPVEEVLSVSPGAVRTAHPESAFLKEGGE